MRRMIKEAKEHVFWIFGGFAIGSAFGLLGTFISMALHNLK